MKDIDYNSNILKIGDQLLEHSEEILNIYEVEDLVLVHFDQGELDPCNVVAYNKSGEKIWRISPVKKEEENGATPVVDVAVTDKYVQVRNISLDRFRVDLETGDIEFLGWSR